MASLGTLSEIGLAPVLRMLAHGGKTGCLAVSTSSASTRCHFFEGSLLYARSDAYVGDDAVVALFGWEDGELEYVPETRPPAPNVTRPMEALIALGEKAGQTLHRMNGYFDRDQVVFQWVDDPPGTAHCNIGAAEWKLLKLLDGIRTFGEVLRASRVPRLVAQRALFDLTEAGFLERVDVVKTVTARRRPPFSGFSILAPNARQEPVVELDERLLMEWKRIARFARGVERVRMNSLRGRSRNFRVCFKPDVDGAVLLSDDAIDALAAKEGEKVEVRPIGSRVRAPKA